MNLVSFLLVRRSLANLAMTSGYQDIAAAAWKSPKRYPPGAMVNGENIGGKFIPKNGKNRGSGGKPPAPNTVAGFISPGTSDAKLQGLEFTANP